MERKTNLKKKPLLLHYYITNRCNSKCTFCTIWQETPKFDARIDDVASNLQSAWNAGCSFVDFTGGEPLLNKDLPDFLKIAKKIGFITSVTTNGILFPHYASQLAGLIDLLHFSIDADNEEMHDRIHGAKSFKTVIESIDIAKKYNLTPDLLCTYTNENIDHLSGLAELASKKKIIMILDPVFSLQGREQVSGITHTKAQKLSRQKGVYLNTAHLHFRSNGANHVREPLCKAVESTIVILPNNSLALPCYHHRSDCVPISNDLDLLLSDKNRAKAIELQGRYSFCEGCHINCYFDPSYTRMNNRLHWLSLLAKSTYSFDKYIRYRNPFPSGILKSLIKRMFRGK